MAEPQFLTNEQEVNDFINLLRVNLLEAARSNIKPFVFINELSDSDDKVSYKRKTFQIDIQEFILP